MTEQAVQKLFFIAGCVLMGIVVMAIGLMTFVSGPTGTYHVDASYSDGALVSRLMQDRRFWVDTTTFRGAPEDAWKLYFRLTGERTEN